MCGNVDLLSLNLRVYLLRYGVEQLVERPLCWVWRMISVPWGFKGSRVPFNILVEYGYTK